MDSPIDNPFDLGLVNYVKHPTDPNYVVFRFADLRRAKDFEAALKAQNIWFEKGEEERPARTYYLYGLRNLDFGKAQKINYDVEARNRTFIISNNFFRWALILIVLGMVILGTIGYYSSRL